MSEEREQLRAAVRAVLDRQCRVRDHLGSGPDLSTWQTLAHDVGVAGLLIPEKLGGAGGSYADAAAVFDAAGQTLAPVPLLSTVALTTSVLLAADDENRSGPLLSRIADGTVATVALGQSSAATHHDNGWTLRGTHEFVLDAAAADILLVTASTADGVGLFVVGSGATGLRTRMLDSLDLTRPLGVIELTDTPVDLIAVGDAAARAVEIGTDLAIALWSAESVGAMQHCLDAAVDYAKQRVQFDRPIGSFQAIKHTLVDVLLEVEMARSVADLAVGAADDWLGDRSAHARVALGLAASSAKAVCADSFMATAEETLHVFGGTGFTWEHDAHLYYRRAKFGELYLGTADEHRDRVADLAGLASTPIIT
jgi:alkylation response protein AidB-like acyl-CoA dehydrogenase